jgi:hypothetical protein
MTPPQGSRFKGDSFESLGVRGRGQGLGEPGRWDWHCNSQPVLRSLSAFVVIASAVALADRCWLRARGYLRAGLPFKEDGEAEGAENGRAVR